MDRLIVSAAFIHKNDGAGRGLLSWSRTFLSYSLTYTHTALIEAGREPTTLVAGQPWSPHVHSAVKLQCGQVEGGGMIRWCCMKRGMMNYEWEAIIPPYLSYLLVLRVLRPEVTTHKLEFQIEMRQPVKQIHPPRWRVVYYGRHPEHVPAGCHFTH